MSISRDQPQVSRDIEDLVWVGVKIITMTTHMDGFIQYSIAITSLADVEVLLRHFGIRGLPKSSKGNSPEAEITDGRILELKVLRLVECLAALSQLSLSQLC